MPPRRRTRKCHSSPRKFSASAALVQRGIRLHVGARRFCCPSAIQSARGVCLHPCDDMTVASRFLETEQPQWFREPALVACPQCGGQACVQVVERGTRESSGGAKRFVRLTCGACGHSVSSEHDDAHWGGAVHVSAACRCGQCGRPLHQSVDRRRKPPRRSTVKLRCPGCGHTTTAPANLSADRRTAPADPNFGLPLWLQTSCCGNVLWARNASHLVFLENYVGAKLREREPNQNGSSVSRLPSWMKQAKHRVEILAAIAHLRRTLVEPELRAAVV